MVCSYVSCDAANKSFCQTEDDFRTSTTTERGGHVRALVDFLRGHGIYKCI